jgi:hypothetical protein
MKNKKWLLIFSALSAICIGFSCKKDGLTKETQTGANTFSCKVDGVVFKPSESGGLFGSPPITVYNFPYNGFTLLGKYYGDRVTFSKNVMLNLIFIKTTGSYKLGLNKNNGIYEIDYAGGPVFRTDETHTGIVNITRCDSVNHIYSGNFSFTGIDKNTGKTVNVTDGRFDVKQ